VTALGSIPNSSAQTSNTGLEDIEYKTKEEHATLGRDDFMKLFVTQLQYQDPMNPMESAEMASQVAQFNMVDLMYKNNAALESMTNAQNMAASVTAISLLGHRVEYEGSKIFVSDKGVEPFSIFNDQDVQAVDVKASIYSPAGNLVKELNIGPLEPGQEVSLEWDGTDTNGDKAHEGAYTVSISAEDASGQEVELTTKTMGMVSGIENGKDGFPKITIKGDKAIDFKDITKVES